MSAVVYISHEDRGGIKQFWAEMLKHYDFTLVVISKDKLRWRLIRLSTWPFLIFIQSLRALIVRHQDVISNDLVSHVVVLVVREFRSEIRVSMMFHGTDFLGRWYAPMLIYWINRASINGVELIFVSNLIRDCYQHAKMDVSKSKIVCPVISTSFKGELRRRLDDRVRLMFVGHLNYQKGVSEILDLVTAVSFSLQEVDISIDIVGDGLLFSSLSKKEYPMNVNFHGSIPFAEVQELFAQSHALLIYPQDVEAFGKIAIEANLNGCGVLMSSQFCSTEISEICAVEVVNSNKEFFNTLRNICIGEHTFACPFVQYNNELEDRFR